MNEERYYIEKIKLSGYKTIYGLDLKLKDGLNILIGMNGTGKSNFLKALNSVAFLRYLRSARRRIFHLLDYEILYRESQGNKTLNLISTVEKGNEMVEDVEIRFRADKIQLGQLAGQKNYTRKFQKKENIEKTESGTDDYKEFIMFLKEIDRSVTFIPFSIIGDVPLLDEDIKYSYNLEIKQIIDSPESFLWPQIRIISGLIEAIENSISNTFEKIDLFYEDDIKDMVVNDIQSIVNDFFADGIKRQLRKYTPIKDIGLSESFSVKISNGMIFLSNVKLQFFVNNQWIQWDFLSDGTKRMFQFILEVLGEENLVLIEEPELGIHPTQLNLLMDFLKEQSSHKQIILSTHAPTVLNILEKDEIDRILVVKWDQRNYTNIENMSETKIVKVCEFMRTKGLLSEYWLHHDMEV